MHFVDLPAVIVVAVQLQSSHVVISLDPILSASSYTMKKTMYRRSYTFDMICKSSQAGLDSSGGAAVASSLKLRHASTARPLAMSATGKVQDQLDTLADSRADSTDSEIRYLAYGARLRTALRAGSRYVAYVSTTIACISIC
jgi:hypothetical protein